MLAGTIVENQLLPKIFWANFAPYFATIIKHSSKNKIKHFFFIFARFAGAKESGGFQHDWLSKLPRLRQGSQLCRPGGGLCPECARSRTACLADLQRQYEAALQAGESETSARVAEIIRDYQRSEGVRLQAVPPRYRVD